jgi:hypothetical protein
VILRTDLINFELGHTTTSAIRRLQENLIQFEGKYNILIDFAVPLILVRLIKICLNETYSKVCLCKHLSVSYPKYSQLLAYAHDMNPLEDNTGTIKKDIKTLIDANKELDL